MTNKTREGARSQGVFHNIRSPGMFARHPRIGLAMFVVGSLVFAFVAHNVVNNGSLVAWDDSMARSLQAKAQDSPPWIHAIMVAGYYIGNQLIAAIGIVLGIYFLRKRCWRELVMLINGFGISALLFLLLVHSFDRARPVYESRVEDLPGFPSGHAVAVAASYGLLLYFFFPRIESRAGKVWGLAGVLIVSLYVLYSRAFLGGHYPSDLVAGFAVGIAWSGLAHTAVELIFQKRDGVTVKRES